MDLNVFFSFLVMLIIIFLIFYLISTRVDFLLENHVVNQPVANLYMRTKELNLLVSHLPQIAHVSYKYAKVYNNAVIK